MSPVFLQQSHAAPAQQYTGAVTSVLSHPDLLQPPRPLRPQEALKVVAQAYRVPTDRLSWLEVPQRLLVLHTPWARVAVGRSPREAARRAGQGEPLREALEAVYPEVWGKPWHTAWQLREATKQRSLRRFLQWAVDGLEGESAPKGCWQLDTGYRVIGAWASWPDAVLVERTRAGGREYQVRLSRWAVLD